MQKWMYLHRQASYRKNVCFVIKKDKKNPGEQAEVILFFGLFEKNHDVSLVLLWKCPCPHCREAHCEAQFERRSQELLCAVLQDSTVCAGVTAAVGTGGS